MTNKPTSKSRSKKALGTTLGKAPSSTADEPLIDLSHVRKPIETSIFGLTHVLRLFETATDEVRRYVAYECDLLYECRICRTIYRSLANFILHKRSYCTESFRCKTNSKSSKKFQQNQFNLLNEEIKAQDCDKSGESSPTISSTKTSESSQLAAVINTRVEIKKKKDLSGVLNHLYDKQESSFITEQCLSEEISNESQSLDKGNLKNNIALQTLDNSDSGVYQTLFPQLKRNGKIDFMKTEVMEIHNILEHNEAILGADGKIVVSDNDKNAILKNNYTCSVCNVRFSTKKTLVFHIKYKHNNSRLIYPCPDCKETFANAWCVFRHLYKVHQKSTTQVRKLRNLIHDSAIKRGDDIERKSKSSTTGSELPDENLKDQQWMNNLEGDNDLQRCGGCGRKFERRAALHSHSQFCAKRIAVCNALKENTGKKSQFEDKQERVIKTSTNEKPIDTNTRRRKPLVAQKIEYYHNRSVLEEIIGPFPQTNPCKTMDDNIQSKIENNKATETSYIPTERLLDEVDKNDNQKLHNANTFYIGSVVVSKVCQKAKDYLKEGGTELCIAKDKNVTASLENDSVKDATTDDKDAKPIDSVIRNTDNFLNITLDDISMINLLKTVELDNTVVRISDANIEKFDTELISSSNCNAADIKEKTLSASNEYQDNEQQNRYLGTITDTVQTAVKTSLEKKSLKYVNLEKLTCLPCKRNFRCYKSLMKHMALHFSWNRYQCSICKYVSYTKSKCKHHAKMHHKIIDRNKLNDIIIHLSRSKTCETATNFIKHYNTRKAKSTKLNINKEKSKKLKSSENVSSATSTDMPNYKPISTNMKDPLVRKMVMEVIFGTAKTATEELSGHSIVNHHKDTNNTSAISNIDMNESSENIFVDHDHEDMDAICTISNIDINKELLETPTKTEVISMSEDSNSPENTLQDYSRPVRRRNIPLHKDFLYDMKHVIKLKRTKDKMLKSKIKFCGKAIKKHLNTETKEDSHSETAKTNTIEDSINCALIISTSETALSHVTGDCTV